MRAAAAIASCRINVDRLTQDDLMSLGQFLQVMPAGSSVRGTDLRFSGVAVDLGSIQEGRLFLQPRALTEQTAEECRRAMQMGAVGLIAIPSYQKLSVPGIYYENTLLILWRMAAWKRLGLQGVFVAVLGGNGKTTVTQMLGHILRSCGERQAHCTSGNQNNHIGVPITIINAPNASNTANPLNCVIELGMNHPGEIKPLAGLVLPDIVLINNSQREHLEHLKSVKAAALENGSAITALKKGGRLIFPVCDEYSSYWRRMAIGRKKSRFSTHLRCDYQGRRLDSGTLALASPKFSAIVRNEKILGDHGVHNALAAATCAAQLGVTSSVIESALTSFTPPNGRLDKMEFAVNGRRLILFDDTYNSNPDSSEAAIKVATSFGGRCLIIFGDMGECSLPQYIPHQDIGTFARERGACELWSIGTYSGFSSASFGLGGRHYGETASCLLDTDLHKALFFDVVLVKGSRRLKMESVVKRIKNVAEGCSDQRVF